MTIRNANINDIEDILKIYGTARKYMIENGNPNQWDNGYPDESIIMNDISKKELYVVEQEGELLGVFVFFIGEEPTYRVIEQGEWRQNKEYGAIHRVASAGKIKGFTKICFDYGRERIDYLRIDTHYDNKTMQGALEKYGFKRCGIIHVRNGERIAFDYI